MVAPSLVTVTSWVGYVCVCVHVRVCVWREKEEGVNDIQAHSLKAFMQLLV